VRHTCTGHSRPSAAKRAAVPDDYAGWLEALEQAASEDALFDQLAELRPPSSKLVRQQVRGRLVKVLHDKLKELGSSALPAKVADAWLQRGGDQDLQGRAFVAEEIEPWSSPVAGEEVLDELEELFDAYVYASAVQLTALALWAAYSHVFDLFGISPILDVTSPTKRCGKTTACIVLRHICRRPLLSSNLTPAAMFRAIEAWTPTLIVDEGDSFVNLADDLRGILNAGHTFDTAFVLRAEGDQNEPRVFSTWCPKVVAAIGHLPDTIEDRSVQLAFVRKPQKVRKKDAFDPERVRADCRDVRARLARWTQDNLDAIAAAVAGRPAGLNDREWNNWRPLLMVAGAAGGDWLEKAMKAAAALCGVDVDPDVEDEKVLALRHVWEVVEPDKRIASVDVLKALVARDDGSPWAKYWEAKLARDEVKTPGAHLARLLSPFGVHPKQLKIDDKNVRGYDAEWFKAEAVATYLEKDATDGTDATGGSRSQAGRSVSSVGSVFSRGVRVCASGDRGYPKLLADAYRNGHITEAEGEQQFHLHKTIAWVLERPCRYPQHAQTIWFNNGGRPVCGVCHPRATP
jgi:Protein of unknown function (DUF3631)